MCGNQIRIKEADGEAMVAIHPVNANTREKLKYEDTDNNTIGITAKLIFENLNTKKEKNTILHTVKWEFNNNNNNENKNENENLNNNKYTLEVLNTGDLRHVFTLENDKLLFRHNLIPLHNNRETLKEKLVFNVLDENSIIGLACRIISEGKILGTGVIGWN